MLQALVNPHQWVFHRYMSGQEVNILKFDKRVRDFYQQKQLTQLEAAAQATNHIAVENRLLSRTERTKYENKRVAVGRRMFYLFQRDAVPPEVFFKLKDRTKILHTKDDE